MEAFERFWKAYPKRLGSNPKQPALAKFQKYVDSGVDPEQIIAGAREYANAPGTKQGTEFVCMAVTWLNQKRWLDYRAAKVEMMPTRVFVELDSPQWKAWQKVRRSPISEFRERGYRCGWYFESEWPP